MAQDGCLTKILNPRGVARRVVWQEELSGKDFRLNLGDGWYPPAFAPSILHLLDRLMHYGVI
jgi:hypothetical protein